MGVNCLLKTVTRQRRGCSLNPGPSVPESSTLATRLPRRIIRGRRGVERKGKERKKEGDEGVREGKLREMGRHSVSQSLAKSTRRHCCNIKPNWVLIRP